MPTILRIQGYKVFFFSHEGNEPAHVHVRKGNGVAKFWLTPLRLDHSAGFKKPELTAILRILETHENELLRAWNEIE